ncbi:hypothetical protein FHX10_006540 [Rhizobium sp. BK591]|uniref:hypothetical protein n=1 Tax=Rhizobium sp. BK591 TaxID=2586985 RepID=UPI00104F2E97|nr:hypothetical protein [Rhizobium sp. BK591]MBB3746987.1 hypothetical protein [Rhizobium sp. BK591]
MSLLAPDGPVGRPTFALSDDQIATVVDLVCRGSSAARSDLTAGMLEVPITIVVRKAMRRVKKTLGLTNLQIRGEVELEDMSTNDPTLLGRIDITLQFMHQFGDEDAYVAIECKRVHAGDTGLNARYVTEGVDRFFKSRYAAGHDWGFMLGYVLALPASDVVKYIDARLVKIYGKNAGLAATDQHAQSLAVLEGALVQNGGDHKIRLRHIFVDMLPASKATVESATA